MIAVDMQTWELHLTGKTLELWSSRTESDPDKDHLGSSEYSGIIGSEGGTLYDAKIRTVRSLLMIEELPTSASQFGPKPVCR